MTCDTIKYIMCMSTIHFYPIIILSNEGNSMVTIKEIADLAGVSRGTVDRVINRRGNVNPETEKKILNILERMNYKPNRAGLALAATRKNYTIGVVLFSQSNLFFDDIVAGIHAELEELKSYGVSVLIKRTGFSAAEQARAIRELEQENIAGLILTPFEDPIINTLIEELDQKSIPVVTVNTDIENSRRLAYVGSNYYEGGRTAAGLMNLITQGEIHLGIVIGSSLVLCHKERIHGFMDTIDQSYHRIQLIETVENNDDEIESYKVTTDLLKRRPDINALFFAGAGVYGGCKAVIESKREIKVISFDTLPTTVEMLNENIISATISQQPFGQGHDALEILFEYLLSKEKPRNKCNYVPSTIIIKENVGGI